jgi:hypothetical protein
MAASVAVGRRNWTFDVYTLIEACKMNDIDPQTLARSLIFFPGIGRRTNSPPSPPSLPKRFTADHRACLGAGRMRPHAGAHSVMADLAENARRKAQGKKPAVISPLALEAVRRIDELFEIERAINDQRTKP